MKKTTVFISVIDEEKEIALALKRVLEASFMNLVDVFVAFDPNSLPPGKKWIDEITAALKRCEVEVIIASPSSVKRQWINFEAGAGWIRGIPVIPLCHSGMLKGKLPKPLDDLQAAVLTNEAELKTIVPVLANALGSAVPVCDFSEFIKTVKGYEELTIAMEGLAVQSPIATTAGLSQHEFAALVRVASAADSSISGLELFQLKQELESAGHTPIATMLAVKKLQRMNLVELKDEEDYNRNTYAAVFMTEPGWQWLEDNKAQIRLTMDVPASPPVKDDGPPIGDDVPF